MQAPPKKPGGAIVAHARKPHAGLTPEVGADNAAFLRQSAIPVIEQRARLALEAASGLTPTPAVRRRPRG